MSKLLVIGCGGVAGVAIANAAKTVMFSPSCVLPAVRSPNVTQLKKSCSPRPLL